MKTECPHCGQHYEVDEEYIGQIANCIICKQEFVIEMIRPDNAIQEKKEKQPITTSTENSTIEKESVINKPEKTKMVNSISKYNPEWKYNWPLVGCLFLFFCIFLLSNSCSDYGKTPKPKGPPTNAEWVRYFNKVKADEEKKQQQEWDYIRNY